MNAERQKTFEATTATIREQHRVEEAEKGERIAEGEDGVYIRETAHNLTGLMRLEVVAYNQGGHDCTIVALDDILAWVKKNRPELLR